MAGMQYIPRATATPARCAPMMELRIGYHEASAPLVPEAQKRLGSHFALTGVAVKWVEFAFGPPLLDNMNVGAVDCGHAGDMPPLSAQAAKSRTAYGAVIPTRGFGQAILAPEVLPARTLTEHKGGKSATLRSRARAICSSRLWRAPTLMGRIASLSISPQPKRLAPPPNSSRRRGRLWTRGAVGHRLLNARGGG